MHACIDPRKNASCKIYVSNFVFRKHYSSFTNHFKIALSKFIYETLACLFLLIHTHYIKMFSVLLSASKYRAVWALNLKNKSLQYTRNILSRVFVE